jgi:hypothetical protein
MPLMPGGSLLCSSRVVGVRSSASKRVTLSIDKTIPGPQTGPAAARAPPLRSGPASADRERPINTRLRAVVAWGRRGLKIVLGE